MVWWVGMVGMFVIQVWFGLNKFSYIYFNAFCFDLYFFFVCCCMILVLIEQFLDENYITTTSTYYTVYLSFINSIFQCESYFSVAQSSNLKHICLYFFLHSLAVCD